jgi:hypothetical protein
MIVVHPGVYQENVILYKNVILQASGTGSSMRDPNATVLFANPTPADRLSAWHAKIVSIRGNDPFVANEAPGIMVFGDVPGLEFPSTPSTPLIDGFYVFGAIQGGGIYVYNGAHALKISNNKIRGNQGSYGGGITVGQPEVGGILNNNNVTIEYNKITGNGGIFGAGGVALTTGSNNYVVKNNILMGNLSRWNGGGVTHDGLSDGGIIENNTITFNEVSTAAVVGGEGGGIYIQGELPNGPAALGTGAGNITITGNLIQGNLAGAGSGGGIRASGVNGDDVEDDPYVLNIFDNIIVNNVATLAGGGISLQDVTNANIINNTIANNDSTATAAIAFAPGVLDSTPQGAGIVASAHGGALAAASGQTFSDPVLLNNILWHNRSFFNDHNLNGGAGGLSPASQHPTANAPDYWDLAVTGVAGQMSPLNCILTDPTGYDGSNIPEDPTFLSEYLNLLQTATVLDEGGNAITVRFTPVRPGGNYHIPATSLAMDAGQGVPPFGELGFDYDGEPRPSGAGVDIGADEFNAPSITVTSPGGAGLLAGEDWQAGTTHTIAWTYVGDIGLQVTIQLLSGDRVASTIAFSSLAGDNRTGSFSWTLPTSIRAGSNYRIRVSSKSNRAVSGTSDFFTISR